MKKYPVVTLCGSTKFKSELDSIEPIDRCRVEQKVRIRIMVAEMYAARQYDIWSHLASDYPSDDFWLNEMTTIKKGKYQTMDPWVPEDESVPVCDYPFIGHADKNSGYDPFKIFGKQKMARFVEEILLRKRIELGKEPLRTDMMEQIEWYCDELGISLPAGYPEKMTDAEMEEWIECWDEFDPCPDI